MALLPLRPLYRMVPPEKVPLVAIVAGVLACGALESAYKLWSDKTLLIHVSGRHQGPHRP
ncbi:hypothetical protein GQ42DRAFT_163218 [Ramicandelaber brevisporus]|nr:hypothetical protein GQ42DRAFT_163218 [Ramicandelaber brevisporus]